jgi:hypothetical protein
LATELAIGFVASFICMRLVANLALGFDLGHTSIFGRSHVGCPALTEPRIPDRNNCAGRVTSERNASDYTRAQAGRNTGRPSAKDRHFQASLSQWRRDQASVRLQQSRIVKLQPLKPGHVLSRKTDRAVQKESFSALICRCFEK